MTLQPYDGANRVLLPDGRECWEKETETHGGSETFLSYQYSVTIDAGTALDYWGRVVGLKLKAPDGTWNDPVFFMPATSALIERLREVMERGWTQGVTGTELGHGVTHYSMGSVGYHKVMADVLAVVRGVKP